MEINQYKDLGLYTNVTDLENRLIEMKANMANDFDVVKVIRQEAKSMEMSFSSFLEKQTMR